MDRRDWWRLAGFGDVVRQHFASRRGRHSQTEFGNEEIPSRRLGTRKRRGRHSQTEFVNEKITTRIVYNKGLDRGGIRFKSFFVYKS